MSGLKMNSPFTETSVSLVDIKTVVKRHDASLLESSTESGIQIMFQWGSYLSLIFLIDKIMYARNEDANILCSDYYFDYYILEDIICKLNDKVEFRSKAILWFSGLGSILSLSLSQLKAHNVQHEFLTNCKMKAAYLSAAFANTVCILQEEVLNVSSVLISLFGLICVLFLSCLARFIVFKNNLT